MNVERIGHLNYHIKEFACTNSFYFILMMINTLELQGYIKKKLFQYEIISGAYVMEPWEKITFSNVYIIEL